MRRILYTCTLLVSLIGLSNQLFAAASDYKLQTEDLLEITVLQEPELSISTRVQGGGAISYWLLDDIQVVGKTARQVKEKIEELLKADYLVNPQVSVRIVEYSEQTFSVVGEVRLPMSYPLPPEKEFHIMDAIGLAGGFTPNARKSSIMLYRDGKKQKFDYKDLLIQTDDKKKNLKKIIIKHGDVIEVPARFF